MNFLPKPQSIIALLVALAISLDSKAQIDLLKFKNYNDEKLYLSENIINIRQSANSGYECGKLDVISATDLTTLRKKGVLMEVEAFIAVASIFEDLSIFNDYNVVTQSVTYYDKARNKTFRTFQNRKFLYLCEDFSEKIKEYNFIVEDNSNNVSAIHIFRIYILDNRVTSAMATTSLLNIYGFGLYKMNSFTLHNKFHFLINYEAVNDIDIWPQDSIGDSTIIQQDLSSAVVSKTITIDEQGYLYEFE